MVGAEGQQRESLICHAEPGDCLGERSLVAGNPAMATCTASVDSVALLLQPPPNPTPAPTRDDPLPH